MDAPFVDSRHIKHSSEDDLRVDEKHAEAGVWRIVSERRISRDFARRDDLRRICQEQGLDGCADAFDTARGRDERVASKRSED